MKNAEPPKLNHAPVPVNTGTAQPAAPARLVQPARQTTADPSSSFRSSRYPVPQFEFRTQATR